MTANKSGSNARSEEANSNHEPWRTAEGEAISPAVDVTDTTGRQVDLQMIRVIRTLVGAIVLVALLLDLGGATQRVIEQPALGGIALAAIAQLVQKEDIEQLTETFTGSSDSK